jgi:hypothetical protein
MLLDLADQCLYKSKRAGRNRASMPNVIDGRFGDGPNENEALIQA